jgi:DNA mismatch endonuclease (patch repair protein)
MGYWLEKFGANVARDECVASELQKRGWHVIGIWECQTKNPEELSQILHKRVMDGSSPH